MATTSKNAKAIHVCSAEVRDLGPFSHVRIDVPTKLRSDEGQWIVLLGDNGSGKTTLLRAIALALQGFSAATMHLSMLGRPIVRQGRDVGVTQVSTSAGDRSLRITSHVPSDDDRRDLVDVFAFGTGRGTATGGRERAVDLGPHLAAASLFDSRLPVIHAETWLRRQRLDAQVSQASQRRFDRMLAALASLLPSDERIAFEGGEIFIESGGRRAPFASMSDGYLTTLGWTIDLIARWLMKHPDATHSGDIAADMPCVVLVDELDLHLHPRWQLDIIPRLRAAFPKTTFVVTTHNPLTLQGTRPGEVFVLERDAEGTIGITQRDITPGLDANRILTDWFGLPTTLDNDTRDLMAEHLKLLWEKVPESHARRRALERTLRDRLGRYADTSLERIAQSVVAEVLHKKAGGPLADITPADRSEIVTQVETRLDDLDAPPATSTAREPAPTWRRTPTTSKARKATPERKAAAKPKTAAKRKATTPRKTTPKR